MRVFRRDFAPQDAVGLPSGRSPACLSGRAAHPARDQSARAAAGFERSGPPSHHAEPLRRSRTRHRSAAAGIRCRSMLRGLQIPSRPRGGQAVREAKGEPAVQLIDHLKKPDMAREAERLLAGTRWAPEPRARPMCSRSRPPMKARSEAKTCRRSCPKAATTARPRRIRGTAAVRRSGRVSAVRGAAEHRPRAFLFPSTQEPGRRAGLFALTNYARLLHVISAQALVRQGTDFVQNF